MKCILAILIMLGLCLGTGCSQIVGDDGQFTKYKVEQLLPLVEQASATTTRLILTSHPEETLAKVREIGTAILEVTKDGVTVDDLTEALDVVLNRVIVEQNLDKRVEEMIRFVFDFAATMAEAEIVSRLEPVLENEKVKVTAMLLDAIAKGVVRGATKVW